MEIITTKEDQKLTIALSGRLDTETAPRLDEVIDAELEGIESLVIDFTDLEYVSSAGLRVLLKAQKRMNAQGSMVVTKVCPEIMEVFEITGFSDILTIE